VKAVSELFSPVSGEVVAVNGDLASHPDHVNSKPHDAWMIRLKVANAAETSSLLDSNAYEALTK
jgi:glycine cleavage system H protein